MRQQPVLYGIAYSPWTLRARWALEHHGIRFTYREHVPLLGEPLLRVRARARGDRATVPLLVNGAQRIDDSLAIMRHADAIGSGGALGVDEPAVAAWADRLEPCLQAMRVRVTRRTLRDAGALKEAASVAAPGMLAGMLRPVAARGARYIARKYGFDADANEDEEARATIARGLDAIRSALGEKAYIETTFSAADIMAVTCLQGVQPAAALVRLGEATRRVWQDDELAQRYSDLLQWRDAVLEKHRAAAH